ncbi:MAG TPA: permease [Candidatus Sulfotelmatobacter sp.]|jgi:uncharacterized membrane protein YraQ (UPF0718 family)|nr:permease [Candidatus Sulfotelmatobacter sp.]
MLLQILWIVFSMFWEVLWPLILGFALSGIVQAVVSHKTLAKTLGGDSPRNLTLATLFGIASSSCSYAAVALARSLFQKGASFTSAMVFELASTNLVIEIGIILAILMGWQFMAAEFIGGIIMVVLIALLFRLTLTPKLIALAREQAAQGLQGKMEGHAAMDMSVTNQGTFIQRLVSKKGFTAVSQYFVMDLASVWIDITLGFFIAGAVSVLVPHAFWQTLFLMKDPHLAFIEGPLVGPLVALISSVCSVGNVPLAAVLWQGGISFGGVVSFIFADLIVLPILNIYRKYYGWKMMCYIFIIFYCIMAAAGYFVEFIFTLLHFIPANRNVIILTEGFTWNYTSWLNILFLLIAAILVYRFIKSGGLPMLQMMDKQEQPHHH